MKAKRRKTCGTVEQPGFRIPNVRFGKWRVEEVSLCRVIQFREDLQLQGADLIEPNQVELIGLEEVEVFFKFPLYVIPEDDPVVFLDEELLETGCELCCFHMLSELFAGLFSMESRLLFVQAQQPFHFFDEGVALFQDLPDLFGVELNQGPVIGLLPILEKPVIMLPQQISILPVRM
jgi:hypothetical protein